VVSAISRPRTACLTQLSALQERREYRRSLLLTCQGTEDRSTKHTPRLVQPVAGCLLPSATPADCPPLTVRDAARREHKIWRKSPSPKLARRMPVFPAKMLIRSLSDAKCRHCRWHHATPILHRVMYRPHNGGFALAQQFPQPLMDCDSSFNAIQCTPSVTVPLPLLDCDSSVKRKELLPNVISPEPESQSTRQSIELVLA
jgi:hypothetical protein